MIRPFFRWYDLWIGVYFDRVAKVLYICPLPMIGVAIRLPRECSNCGARRGHREYCVYYGVTWRPR